MDKSRSGFEDLQKINKKKEQKIILKRREKKIRNCLDCDTNRIWLCEANQTNNNTKNFKIKTHSINVITRVEVHRYLQHNLKYPLEGKHGTITKASQVTRKKEHQD